MGSRDLTDARHAPVADVRGDGSHIEGDTDGDTDGGTDGGTDGARRLRALYCIGENPAESEANATHSRHLLEGLDHLVVQDIFRTATADMADVVLPAAADWCEYEGTVTNSERRVQRVRKAIDPPGQARPDTHIICAIADRLGQSWGEPTAEQVWDELRSLSLDWHHGMSYARLAEHGGLQWPCPSLDHPGTPLLHARLWETGAARGPAAPFTPVEHVPPADALTSEYPIRLTTVRVLDAYNSGVQTGGYASPMRVSGPPRDIGDGPGSPLGRGDPTGFPHTGTHGDLQRGPDPVDLGEEVVGSAEGLQLQALGRERGTGRTGTAALAATAIAVVTTRRPSAVSGTRSGRPACAVTSVRTSWGRASRSTSSSAAAPAPTSAARRRRCSTRSRGSGASRGTSRRSRR